MHITPEMPGLEAVHFLSCSYQPFPFSSTNLAPTNPNLLVWSTAGPWYTLNASTTAMIGRFGCSWLICHAVVLSAPAFLTVLLVLGLGGGTANQLLLLWDCSVPDLAYLYVMVYVYVLLLGLGASE